MEKNEKKKSNENAIKRSHFSPVDFSRTPNAFHLAPVWRMMSDASRVEQVNCCMVMSFVRTLFVCSLFRFDGFVYRMSMCAFSVGSCFQCLSLLRFAPRVYMFGIFVYVCVCVSLSFSVCMYTCMCRCRFLLIRAYGESARMKQSKSLLLELFTHWQFSNVTKLSAIGSKKKNRRNKTATTTKTAVEEWAPKRERTEAMIEEMRQQAIVSSNVHWAHVPYVHSHTQRVHTPKYTHSIHMPLKF